MIIMRKAVAIPYIIALILGIIVVALLAYWLVSTGIIGNKTGNEAQCTAYKTEYCTTQSTDSCDKAKTVCGGKLPADWKDYCRFIPNWQESSGTHCP